MITLYNRRESRVKGGNEMVIEKQSTKQPTEYWKQIVMIMTLGWVVIWLYRTALAPVYPQISAHFGGASDSQIGSISSFYFLGYVLMQIPSGLLVDRFGKKTVLIPGFTLFGVGTLIVATAPSLLVVYIGSVLAGVGCGTFYGVAYSLTGQYVPASRKSLATAIVNCGTAIGSGGGMIASSYLVVKLGLHWNTMLYVVLAFVVVMLGLFMKFIRKEEQPDKQSAEASALAPQEKMTMKRIFAPKMIAVYILYFSTCYAYYLTDTWLPNFLATERGFEGTTIGLASSLVFFTAIPGALLFSRLADKFVHRKIQLIVVLEILAGIALFTAVAASSKNLLLFGLIAYGFFGKITVEPLIISWLGEHIPSKGLATTLGIFNFFGMSSSVIAPSLTGWISDATGSKIYSFYLAVGILAIGTAVFYIFNRKDKPAVVA